MVAKVCENLGGSFPPGLSCARCLFEPVINRLYKQRFLQLIRPHRASVNPPAPLRPTTGTGNLFFVQGFSDLIPFRAPIPVGCDLLNDGSNSLSHLVIGLRPCPHTRRGPLPWSGLYIVILQASFELAAERDRFLDDVIDAADIWFLWIGVLRHPRSLETNKMRRAKLVVPVILGIMSESSGSSNRERYEMGQQARVWVMPP